MKLTIDPEYFEKSEDSDNQSQRSLSNNSPLTISLEESEKKLSCMDSSHQKKFDDNKSQFDEKIVSITRECVRPQEKEFYKNKNSIIYELSSNPNILVKESKLLLQTYRLVNTTDIAYTSKIDCYNANKLIEKSLNEAKSAEHYSQILKSLYPQHFVDIKHLHTCKYHPDTDFSNFFKMEKVDGITMENFVESTEISDNTLCKLILQMLYILIHSNSLGLYHNDLKLNNIMVYMTGHPNIVYDQMDGIKLEILNPNYLFKLIDYSDVLIVEQTNSNEIKLIDIIKFVSLIKNITKEYINSSLLIQTIENNLGADIFGFSDDSYRLLSIEEIDSFSTKVNKNTIVQLFHDIQNIQNLYPQINISFTSSIIYKRKYLQAKKLLK